MTEEQVVLLDTNDEACGTMEKLQAHREGRLHRAFSVLILNEKGEMLIHQRAFTKYHSGGKWTNACCGHPRPGEDTQQAAERRLMEEMGFTVPLKYLYQFTYKAVLDGGLTEYELDHVFMGVYNDAPQPNPDEVNDWRYVPIEQIIKGIKAVPENYSIWFRYIMDAFPTHFKPRMIY
ncbi:MAG: isopentenyl-diphosphate Delta-isomerase [Chitinophagaceae bacterium]|nr:isopentenyl-diphosphate Delta-isomerase [Chitinophagaceae bacterium]